MSQWVARSWAVVVLLGSGWGAVACGDDPSPAPSEQGSGAGGEGGEFGAAGASGEHSSPNMAGSPAVTPADLVCSADDDCTDHDRAVCDQALGCVACQYDWDCPANHRCRAN